MKSFLFAIAISVCAIAPASAELLCQTAAVSRHGRVLMACVPIASDIPVLTNTGLGPDGWGPQGYSVWGGIEPWGGGWGRRRWWW